MKKKNKDPLTEYVKANRRGSREAEIEMYGHPVNYHRIYVSKKVYDRKKMKAGDRRQPSSFYSIFCFFKERSDLSNALYFTPPVHVGRCGKMNLQID